MAVAVVRFGLFFGMRLLRLLVAFVILVRLIVAFLIFDKDVQFGWQRRLKTNLLVVRDSRTWYKVEAQSCLNDPSISELIQLAAAQLCISLTQMN